MRVICETVKVEDVECAVEQYLKTKNLSYNVVPCRFGEVEYHIAMPVSYQAAPVLHQCIKAHLQTLCAQCTASNVQKTKAAMQKQH